MRPIDADEPSILHILTCGATRTDRPRQKWTKIWSEYRLPNHERLSADNWLLGHVESVVDNTMHARRAQWTVLYRVCPGRVALFARIDGFLVTWRSVAAAGNECPDCMRMSCSTSLLVPRMLTACLRSSSSSSHSAGHVGRSNPAHTLGSPSAGKTSS